MAKPARVEVYPRQVKPHVGKPVATTYDWRMIAPNGQTVATSGGQGYTSRHDTKRGLRAVLKRLGVDLAAVDVVDV